MGDSYYTLWWIWVPFLFKGLFYFFQRTLNNTCKSPYSLLTINCMPVSCMSACNFFMGRPGVWNFVWIRFLDNFNILALCDQLWKIQTVGPLFKTCRSFPYLGTSAASESWFGVKYVHQTLDNIGLFSILQPICPELEYSTAVVSFLFISNPTPWSDYVTPTLHPDTALVSSSCPSST